MSANDIHYTAMQMKKHDVFLSLGTNLGNKEKNLTTAIELLEKTVGNIICQSSFLFTEPWGFESDNAFLNAALHIGTTLTPTQLLDTTQEIEKTMGRTSKSAGGQYEDRLIDIDILLYDRQRIDTERLTVPHPLMLQRQFVTEPLSQILPDYAEVVASILQQANNTASTR